MRVMQTAARTPFDVVKQQMQVQGMDIAQVKDFVYYYIYLICLFLF